MSDLDALLKACDHIEHSEVDDLEKVRLARAVKAVAEHLERAQKTNDAMGWSNPAVVALPNIRKALLSAFEDSGHE